MRRRATALSIVAFGLFAGETHSFIVRAAPPPQSPSAGRARPAVLASEKPTRCEETARKMLPARIATYAAAMSVIYPSTLAIAIGRAIYQRATKGTPDMILPTGSINPVKPGGGYAGQMYFEKPFDEDRLRAAVASMADELGILAEQASVDFVCNSDGSAPRPPHEGSLDWSGIVDGPAGPGTAWLEGWDSATKVITVRCFNGGPLSVLQFNLPGGAWDGSACFNFMKELVHRYCGGEPNRVLISDELRLSAAAAERLRGGPGSFLAYLGGLPRAVLLNCHSYVWSGLCTVPAAFGGPGPALRGALLNLSPEDSAALAKGLKAHGASPFAGLVYAAVNGYTSVLGRAPHGVVQQASLVTAAYEPYIAERNVVGG